MRAVFHVGLPFNSDSKSYPNDDDVRGWVMLFGWECIDIVGLEGEAKINEYKAKAKILISKMPEAIRENILSVIYYGEITSEDTKFIVTRNNSGEITFRLIHSELTRLTTATSMLVRKI